MSNNNQEESDIAAFFTEYNDFIDRVGTILQRIRNVEYNSQTNTTKIYGHTNVEELKVNGIV